MTTFLLTNVWVCYLRRNRFQPGWIVVAGWLLADDGTSTRPVVGYLRDRGVVADDGVDEPNLVDWRHAASKQPRQMIDDDGAFVVAPQKNLLLNDVLYCCCCDDDEMIEDGPDDR